MKKILLFASAMLISAMSFATDFTITSTKKVTKDGITISFAKADGANSPAWFDKGLRLYAENTVTITATSDITSITFNWEKQGSKDFASLKANVGSYSHPNSPGQGKWTGSAKEVVFTLGSKGQLQLNTLSVVTVGGEDTTDDGGGDTPDDGGEDTPDDGGEDDTPATGNAADMALGNNAFDCTVNGAKAIKVGSSKKAGNMTITVPAGAKTLKFYAAAWNKESNLSVSITPAENITPTSITLTADEGIQGGETDYKLSGSEASYVYEFTLTNVNQSTTFTLSGSKRFVVWKATYTVDGDGNETPDDDGETPDTPTTDTVITGLQYADAYYYTDEEGIAYWDFDLYVDVDAETYEVTYPELYLMVDAAKSKTAINGTYGLYWAGVWTSANDSVVSEEDATTGSLTIKNVGNDGIYSFKGSFVATNGKIYTFDQEVEVWAYDYDNDEEIILSEVGTDTPDVSGVEDVIWNTKMVKVIKNGQMYIIREEKVYNLLGAQVN